MTHLSMIVAGTFALLACWHFYMAARGTRGSGAVPTVNGKPVFVPSCAATVLVGLALALCTVLILGSAGMVWLGLPQWTLRWMCTYLAIGLAWRAVGDFRYVGFFKSVKETRFARLDTLFYSPLCVFLAAGVLLVALIA